MDSENRVGKGCVLALMAALALGVRDPPMAVAQVSSQHGETRGMFGNRTLGQPLAPRPSELRGGIQIGPSGNFLNGARPNVSAASVAPGQPIDAVVLVQPFGATSALQPVLYVTPSPQSSVPKYSLPELPEIPGSPSQSSPETNEWAGTSPGAQLRGMHLGIGPPAASTFSVPGDTPRVPDASADRQQPYARSPQLSDRLTRIAYSRNMLSGRGIDVYLSNDIALLQGAVRTAGDRVLLANVLGLEPQVWQIANRLVVEQASASSSHLRNSLSTGTSFPEGISYER